MPVQRVCSCAELASQRKLRVVHVSAQAVPLVGEKNRRGLSEVAGLMPAALASFGIDASLVLPLTREAREKIDLEKYQLEPSFSMNLRLGAKDIVVKVKTAKSPFEPGCPVYFIENAAIFEVEDLYNHQTALERFAFFCRAAMELQRKLGSAPDAFVCHDWQTALIPAYLFKLMAEEIPLSKYSDTFFRNTKSVFAVHTFAYTLEFLPFVLHQAGMGWETTGLPSYAEYHGRLNLLKAGLYRADRAYVRNPDYLQSVINGAFGPGYAGIAKELHTAGRLVGLFPNSAMWAPDREFTEDLALKAAKHEIAATRSVVGRPFPGMELAEQTSPPLTYLVLTPLEKLAEISPKTRELYEKLSGDDRTRIIRALEADEEKRFASIKGPKDLSALLEFLRTDPVCDFEEEMREAGIEAYANLFYPGDINRMLSSEIDLSECEVDELKEDKKAGKAKLYDILKKLGVLSHVIGVLKSLQRIASIPDRGIPELRQSLSQCGHPDPDAPETAGIETEVNEYCMLSPVYKRLSSGKIFRAFIMATILHDVGKCLTHKEHPIKGVSMMRSMSALWVLFDREEREFIRNFIRHHSTFSDIHVIAELHVDNIWNLHRVYPPEAPQRQAYLDALVLMGWADMEARNSISAIYIRKLLEIYKAVSTAFTPEALERKLALLGLDPEKWGQKQWDNWTVRAEDNETERKKSKGLAKKELVNFLKRQEIRIEKSSFMFLGVEDQERVWAALTAAGYLKDGMLQSKFTGEKKNLKLAVDLPREKKDAVFQVLYKPWFARISGLEFFTKIARMRNAWGMKKVCVQIPDPASRAKFVIRIVDYLTRMNIEEANVPKIEEGDVGALVEELKKDRFTPFYDEDSGSVIIVPARASHNIPYNSPPKILCKLCQMID